VPADPADVTVAMEGDLRDGGKAVVGIVRLVLDVALDGGYAPTSEVTFSGRPYVLRIACHVTLLRQPHSSHHEEDAPGGHNARKTYGWPPKAQSGINQT